MRAPSWVSWVRGGLILAARVAARKPRPVPPCTARPPARRGRGAPCPRPARPRTLAGRRRNRSLAALPLQQNAGESTMHIFREPRVTVLARQEFLGAPHIHRSSDTDGPAQAVTEFAGRICYLSFGPDAGIEGGHRLIKGRTTNREYLANILNVRHGSVIEHAVWTVLIEGVSRALTHELVRHRHLSFSQLSQRYVDESEVG